jgi:hypothetical protein
MAGPVQDVVAESERVLQGARDAGIVLRLTGGVAIRRRCPSARRPPLARPYADLDVAVTKQTGRRVLTELMQNLGYVPAQQFNALHGETRLYYDDQVNQRHVDVFVDAVRMCHVITFAPRIALLDDTLTPTDLLLTKLQIVQLNAKDLQDILALLSDQPLRAGAADAVDPNYLGTLWGADWPLWRTSQITLQRVRERMESILPRDELGPVMERIAGLDQVLAETPKSLKWRLRARVGDRVRWYELPEEVE